MLIKIAKNFIIKKKQFFSLNQIIISIEPNTKIESLKEISSSTNVSYSQNENDEINIVVFLNTKNKEDQINKNIYKFDKSNSPITIGRSKCTITLDNNSLSKKHCSLSYNTELKCWKLIDG
jgi:hypothetical protein